MNSVSIWRDRILLHWNGTAPAEAIRANAVHDPDDVLHFWPHIKDYAKWSKRTQSFMLTFSKQNMLRLHAQFGSIPVKSGQDRISELKRLDTWWYDMVNTARKVKELPIDKLPSYEYKIPPLAEYQHRAVVFLRNVKRAPLFADCGMGKTFCVLVSTELQIKKGEIPRGKVLIAGKLSTLESGWIEDSKKFTDLKVVNLWVPSSSKRREKFLERLNSEADVYVINHEGLKTYKEELVAHGFKKIAIDESTILKGFHGMNPRIQGGVLGRALMEIAHSADYRVVMSGTPAPNGPEDLWGQFYFLEPNGLALEASFNDFRHRYMQAIDLRSESQKKFTASDGTKHFRPRKPTDPVKWVVKPAAIEEISKVIEPVSYRARLRDHLKDMPELTVIQRSLEMTPEQSKHYKDMETRLKVEIDDARITVPIRLTQMMKLRQITGGFILDHQEIPHVMKPNPKLTELDSILEDEIAREQKVIIWAEYQWEIETLKNRYKDYGVVSVYGGNDSRVNLENQQRFIKDPSVRIIVAHPKSMAHGVTLTMAHYMVFYSISHSAENNYQCIKRIERAGQKFPMFVYYLLAQKSVDPMIFKALEIKNANQSTLIDQNRVDQMILELWREQWN